MRPGMCTRPFERLVFLLASGANYYLGEYHPYWRVFRRIRNPHFDEFSAQLLDLKKAPGSSERTAAVQRFASEVARKSCFLIALARLRKLLGQHPYVVCCVPSSNPANINPGIREFARQLALELESLDGTSCLRRTVRIRPMHARGQRDQSVHLESIAVVDRELFVDRDVLLCDDVVTSGSTLEAGRKLLLQGGARSVTTLALGRTTHV